MKTDFKRHIALFLALLMSVLALSACSPTTEIISNDTSEESTTQIEFWNSYYLFQTDDVKGYLQFLEDFDYTKYEIVDISIAHESASFYSRFSYFVTYKTIANQ